MQKIGILVMTLTLFSLSCSTTRKAGKLKPFPVEKSFSSGYAGSIETNNLSGYDFFIRKAEIELTGNNIRNRFNASIRFRRPDSLLISVRSSVGIEAARIFLTRDTLLVNDKVNKKLLTGNTRILGVKYGIDPSLIFAVLGDFIIAKADENRIIKCLNGIYRDSFSINGKNIEYAVDCKKGKTINAYFEGTLTTGNITLSFGSFKKMDGLTVPQEIVMKDDLSEMSVNLKIENAEIGWEGKIGFIPGSGYEVVYLK